MAQLPEATAVETAGESVHVRHRDPDEFETIRTPDWAARAAEPISTGSQVRMGSPPGEDDWVVQSVLIDEHAGEGTAREEADQILRMLEG